MEAGGGEGDWGGGEGELGEVLEEEERRVGDMVRWMVGLVGGGFGGWWVCWFGLMFLVGVCGIGVDVFGGYGEGGRRERGEGEKERDFMDGVVVLGIACVQQ